MQALAAHDLKAEHGAVSAGRLPAWVWRLGQAPQAPQQRATTATAAAKGAGSGAVFVKGGENKAAADHTIMIEYLVWWPLGHGGGRGRENWRGRVSE